MIRGASPGKGPELAMLLGCCDQPPSVNRWRKDRRRRRHRIPLPARQSGLVTLRLMMMGVATVVVIGCRRACRAVSGLGKTDALATGLRVGGDMVMNRAVVPMEMCVRVPATRRRFDINRTHGPKCRKPSPNQDGKDRAKSHRAHSSLWPATGASAWDLAPSGGSFTVTAKPAFP